MSQRSFCSIGMRTAVLAGLLLGSARQGSAEPAVVRFEPSRGSAHSTVRRLGPADLEAKIQRILLKQRSPQEEAEVVKTLVAMGSDAIPVLLEWILGDPLSKGAKEGDTIPIVFGQMEQVRRMARAAIEGFPRSNVLKAIQANRPSEPDQEKDLSRLRLIGELGSARGFPLFFEISSNLDSRILHSQHHRMWAEAAIANILASETEALKALTQELDGLSEVDLSIVVGALSQVPRADAMTPLLKIVSNDAPTESRLKALGRKALEFAWVSNPDPRPYLRLIAVSNDSTLRRHATYYLAQLLDLQSVETLIDQINPETVEGRSAARSLSFMAGGRLYDSAPEWEAWWKREQEFWRSRGQDLLKSLPDDRPGVALKALKELTQHPVYRAELAEALAYSLVDLPPETALTACKTIEQIGSARAVPGLTGALLSGASDLREGAWNCLRTITGQDLPADAWSWNRYVSP